MVLWYISLQISVKDYFRFIIDMIWYNFKQSISIIKILAQ